MPLYTASFYTETGMLLGTDTIVATDDHEAIAKALAHDYIYDERVSGWELYNDATGAAVRPSPSDYA